MGNLIQEYDNLKWAEEYLTAALWKYAQHIDNVCIIANGGDGPCNCGLDDILEAFPEPEDVQREATV